MKLQQLEYVIAIAQEGSITRAAKKLFQAQPNISIALKELEEQLGIQIFNRTPSGMVLTPEGEEFLARARGIIEDVNGLEKDFKERSNRSTVLKIESSRTAYPAAALAYVMNSFPTDDGDITFHLLETSMPKVLEDVSNGKCDVGVVRIPASYAEMVLERVQSKALVTKSVKEYTLSLIMREDHPLAKYDDVPFELLKDYPEVLYGDGEPDISRRASINQSFDVDSSGKKFYIHDRGNQLTVLYNVCNAYMWASPMPKWLVERVGLVVKKCSYAHNLNKDIIIYRRNQEANPLVKACVDAFVKFANMSDDLG
ncbi:MAG: LysR family transcriptional regulator [Ruminococcus sp.]|nr:LysR family transcriptional regulator [Ruminococcus sp.]